ncbi:MAG: hypothetical protein IPO69_15955 [Saprospiraceae bacterium]|nr:hypothetical protein [Saprospiraceae bacterium]
MCATMKPVYAPTGMDPDMEAPLIMEILAARGILYYANGDRYEGEVG